jgi:hypothetical protein
VILCLILVFWFLLSFFSFLVLAGLGMISYIGIIIEGTGEVTIQLLVKQSAQAARLISWFDSDCEGSMFVLLCSMYDNAAHHPGESKRAHKRKTRSTWDLGVSLKANRATDDSSRCPYFVCISLVRAISPRP